MARHFLGLRAALLRGAARSGWQQALGMILGLLLALPAAFTAAWGMAVVAGRDDLSWIVLALAFNGLFLVWALGPVLFFSVDETLDPRRLALLPLPPRRLMTGLLAASALGIGPAAVVLVLSGAVVGHVASSPGGLARAGAAVVIAAAACVQFVLCVAASRALTTALSGVLRSRRARDLTVVVGPLLGVGVWSLMQVADPVVAWLAEGGAAAVAGVARWTPPGLAAQAMTLAADGALLAAVGALAGAGAVAAVAVWAWSRALARSLSDDTGTTGAAAAAVSGGLYPRGFSRVPRAPLTAVAAKELRYLLREPRVRAGLLLPALAAVALPVAAVLFAGRMPPQMVVAAALVAYLVAMSRLNQYGIDGRAVWLDIVAGADPVTDLAGRNIGVAVATLPVAAAGAVVVAAATGGWAYLPVALLVTVAVLGVALGVADLTSVYAPSPVPESTNLWGTSTSGQGCVAGLVQFVALAVMGVLLVPVAVAIGLGLGVWPWTLAISAPLATAYGLGLWWLGVRWSAAYLRGREPEFLEALSARQSG